MLSNGKSASPTAIFNSYVKLAKGSPVLPITIGDIPVFGRKIKPLISD